MNFIALHVLMSTTLVFIPPGKYKPTEQFLSVSCSCFVHLVFVLTVITICKTHISQTDSSEKKVWFHYTPFYGHVSHSFKLIHDYISGKGF
jgi:hypothetical protein